jgi:capsid protein
MNFLQKLFSKVLGLKTKMFFKPTIESKGSVVFGGQSYSVEYLLGLDAQALKTKALEMWWKSIHVQGAIQQLNNLTVNAGLRLQSIPNKLILGITTEQANQISNNIEALFSIIRLQKNISHDGTQNLNELESLERYSYDIFGEAFAILRYQNINSGLIGLTVEILNPMLVKDPPDLHRYKNKIIDGIEYNKEKPVAIHVENVDENGRVFFKRIPYQGSKSGKRFVLHNFVQKIPGQKRGISVLAPSFHELERIQVALRLEIETMGANASIGGTIEREKDVLDEEKLREMFGDDPDAPVEGSVPANTLATKEMKIEKGGIFFQNLEPGEKVKEFDTKRPNTNIPDFINEDLKWLGPAIGLPYSLWMMLFNESYSAARGELQVGWFGLNASNSRFSSNFEQPIFEAIISIQIAKGNIILPGFTDPLLRAAYLLTKWLGLPLPSLNPLQEAKASTERIANFTSNREIESQMTTGMSFDDNADRQEGERERVDQIVGVNDDLESGVSAESVEGDSGNSDSNSNNDSSVEG